MQNMQNMIQQLKLNSFINNTHFVNDLDTEDATKTYLAKVGTKGGLVDSGAPLSMTGKGYFHEYIEQHGLEFDQLKKEPSEEVFRFGSGKVFVSEGIYSVPTKLVNIEGNEVVEIMKVHPVDAQIPFLDILEDQGCVIDFVNMTLKFAKSGNIFKLEKTAGGQGIIQFHTNTETFLENFEEDPVTVEKCKAIRNVHRVSGHKMEDNMINMYKQSGEDDTLTRKLINEVVKRCTTCQMKKKSLPRPKISMMKAKTPNDVITLDLKQFNI